MNVHDDIENSSPPTVAAISNRRNDPVEEHLAGCAPAGPSWPTCRPYCA